MGGKRIVSREDLSSRSASISAMKTVSAPKYRSCDSVWRKPAIAHSTLRPLRLD